MKIFGVANGPDNLNDELFDQGWFVVVFAFADFCVRVVVWEGTGI
jgi:hypothetical protein